MVGYIRMDGYAVSDPTGEKLQEALWRLRYAPENLTEEDRFLALAAADCYVHLATHPAGTEAMVQKLRAIRRKLRARSEESVG